MKRRRTPMGCKKLLVLYTGGTIGMQMSAEGLAPASGFEARLRAQQVREAQPLPEWIFRELLPPIDSANMNQHNWLAMVAAIRAGVEQDGCDGVLLLHGTDTLAYSAAALSFLLLGLPAPVILSGSMLPAGAEGSDAWGNLFGAMAALQAGVAPGVQASHLRALLDSGVQGLLLECYGSGTGPADDAELLDVLKAAHERGVVLAAISQCPHGHVEFGVYAAGSQLAATGLVSAGGMTREAALGKLFALLGAGLAQAE